MKFPHPFLWLTESGQSRALVVASIVGMTQPLEV